MEVLEQLRLHASDPQLDVVMMTAHGTISSAVEAMRRGNVRELENTICRAMILCEGDVLKLADLPGRVCGEPPEGGAEAPRSDLSRLSLTEAVTEATERLEKMMILARLAEHRGSRTTTAESLGISRKTLFNKMRQYGLSGDDLDEALP